MMRQLPWRPRMGAATTALLVVGLLGVIAGMQVPRILEPADAGRCSSDYGPPLQQVKTLEEIRPILTSIHESLGDGKMSMEDAVKSVDSLIVGTTLEVSVELFEGADRSERIANLTTYWALEPLPKSEREPVLQRLNREFRRVYGRDSRLPSSLN